MEIDPDPPPKIEPARTHHTALLVVPGLILAVFLTGFASVSYQTVIERLIKLVIGGTSVSSFVVTYATLVGMGVGALIGISPLGRKRFPYHLIALTSALYTLLSAALALPLLQFLSQYMVTRHLQEPFSQLLLHISAILLVLPSAILSGAIIPRIMQYASRGFFRSAGFLYGTYTIGSAVSIYALIRVLLPLFDFRATFLIIAAIFVVAGFIIRRLDAKMNRQKIQVPEARATPVPPKYMSIQFISSAVAIVLEVSIFRAISVAWGSDSPYAFPFGLLTYLAAYAAGSFIVPPLYTRISSVIGLAPLFVLLPLAFLTTLFIPKTIPNQGLLSLFFIGGLQHAGFIAFVSGGFFPVLLTKGAPADIERRSGVLSFVSSLGSLSGGLFLLFIGFPYLGMRLTILIAFAVYLCGIVVWLTSGRTKKYYSLSALIILLLLSATKENAWSGWIQKSTNPYAQYVEGPGGVALIDWIDSARTSGSVIINGTVASHIPYLSSHSTLAALSSGAPNKERLLILGLGGGGIVRDVLSFKDVHAVDVVEWSRELITLLGTPAASQVTSHPLEDPRVRVFATDAKTYANSAQTQGKSYTLIIDNLTVIGWSGSTSIRSVEYFGSMLPLLTEDGTYIITLHHNTEPQYDAAVSGLSRVCPRLASYAKKYIICSKREVAWDTGYMDRVLAEYSQLPSLRNTLVAQPQWLFQKYGNLSKEAYAGVEPIHDMLPYFEYEEFSLWKK